MRKQIIALVCLSVVGALCFIYIAKNDNRPTTGAEMSRTTKRIEDKQLGISFNLPEVYVSRKDTPPPATQKNTLPSKNFERTNPQGFLTFRYETGVSVAANLAKRSTPDYIESEIRQFFKVRYKNYKSISLERGKLQGDNSVEHVFEYTDNDGNRLKAHLIAVPYDNDASAYYIILQAHKEQFDQVVKDLPRIRETIKLNGPASAS